MCVMFVVVLLLWCHSFSWCGCIDVGVCLRCVCVSFVGVCCVYGLCLCVMLFGRVCVVVCCVALCSVCVLFGV